jgi:SpoVK/Ycf46/Vps4 family AAA+-type ATPase
MAKQNDSTTTKPEKQITHRVRKETPAPVAVEEYDVTIVREGKKIILPEGIEYADARRAIKEMEELEEQIMSFNFVLECFPLDGMLSLQRAIEEIYGFSHQSSRGFFGPVPPHKVQIRTGISEKDVESAVWGDFAPPSWEGGKIGITVNPDHPMAIQFNGYCKRKFEKQGKQIFARAAELLREQSIYRGQAIELDLKYLSKGVEFDPEHHAPSFMDTTKTVKLILPRDVEFELRSSVWDSIEYPEDFRANRIPIKHGVLLSGKFGTGKSLTAHATATLCEKSGFTFFFLRTPEHFISAHKLAQIYAPAVLFVEDIDMLMGGDRTPQMNVLLETLDGIGSKRSEVITIFTTNFPERINEAFLRPGRLDTQIEFTPPDGEAASRFVVEYAGDQLAQDAVDRVGEIGEAFAGLVPAVITEGIRKAGRRAIGVHRAKNGSGEPIKLKGMIDADTLLVAAEVMQKQAARASGPSETPEAMQLALLRHVVPGLFNDGKSDMVAAIQTLAAMAANSGRRRA